MLTNNAECREGHAGHITQGSVTPIGSIACVLTDTVCDTEQEKRCSNDLDAIVECTEDDGQMIGVIVEVAEVAPYGRLYCVEPELQDDPVFAYKPGTCKDGSIECQDDAVVTCVGELWLEQTICPETNAYCVERDGEPVICAFEDTPCKEGENRCTPDTSLLDGANIPKYIETCTGRLWSEREKCPTYPKPSYCMKTGDAGALCSFSTSDCRDGDQQCAREVPFAYLTCEHGVWPTYSECPPYRTCLNISSSEIACE